MAASSAVPVTSAEPDAPSGGSQTRSRIVAAAFDLFSDRGYDGTTVEAIAERAGIARRTFFRYFRSKDDVIFPDHDRQLAEIRGFLDAAAALPPVVAVCSGVRLVFRAHLADPEVSVQRYRVARRVLALRQREIASVWRYERMFSGYLRDRLADAPAGARVVALSADVVAAAVVAAHNSVLREWLRNGGVTAPDEALQRLDDALGFVERIFESVPARPEEVSGDQGGDPSDATVVAVFRAPGALDDVVHRLRAHLGDGELAAE